MFNDIEKLDNIVGTVLEFEKLSDVVILTDLFMPQFKVLISMLNGLVFMQLQVSIVF